jgi:hypothetical protein
VPELVVGADHELGGDGGAVGAGLRASTAKPHAASDKRCDITAAKFSR